MTASTLPLVWGYASVFDAVVGQEPPEAVSLLRQRRGKGPPVVGDEHLWRTILGKESFEHRLDGLGALTVDDLQGQQHPAVAVEHDYKRVLATVGVGPGAGEIDVPGPVWGSHALAPVANAITFSDGMVGMHGHMVAPK